VFENNLLSSNNCFFLVSAGKDKSIKVTEIDLIKNEKKEK